MLVVVPVTDEEGTRGRSVRRAIGLALACALLTGAVFVGGAPRARGATLGPVRRQDRPTRDDPALPAGAAFVALTDSLARQIDELASFPSILPTAGLISSPFASRRDHPILHVVRAHGGVDIAAPFGAPVVAPAAGVVVTVETRGTYGLMLELDHGRGMITRYAHLSRARVRAGQSVVRGQRLADVGSSGLATGPHLHYEIRVGGVVVDPVGSAP